MASGGDARPQAKNQSSRKGRKAWRKNVDVTDVERGLEENREDEILHGARLEDAQSEDLFFIDEDADEAVEEKLTKDRVKKLKASEILANKSKVKALYDVEKITKPRKVQGVSKAEMHRLLKLAGKVKGEDKFQVRLSEDGIVKTKAFDVWNTPTDEEKRLRELPAPLQEQSGASVTVPRKVPKTLREGPMRIKHIEVIPHAGKSYNPTYENWKDLIDSEYYKEKTHEDKRVELEQHYVRLQYIMDNEHHSEVESSDDEEQQEDEDAAGANGEQDDDAKYRLSVNAVTERKIKTKTKRNKEQRHAERLKLEEEIRSLKAHIKLLEKLPDIMQEVAAEEQAAAAKPRETKAERKLRRGTRKLGKFDVIEGPIEVKLSDELSDSLRKLRPEGNLLYDQMKRMQAKGMIETRRSRERKSSKRKNTEKWSYKDFK